MREGLSGAKRETLLVCIVAAVDLSSVAALVGDLLAAAAVVLATIELRRSDRRNAEVRLEALAARRTDFYLEQLVALSDGLGIFGASAPEQVKLRSRLLPSGMVPSAEQWTASIDPSKTGCGRASSNET